MNSYTGVYGRGLTGFWKRVAEVVARKAIGHCHVSASSCITHCGVKTCGARRVVLTGRTEGGMRRCAQRWLSLWAFSERRLGWIL
jgi:hypothetical protein